MRSWILSIAIGLSLLIAGGCSGLTGEKIAGLGEQFTLKPGQSVAISGEPLRLKFLEVVADSRCPKGATCIWQGEVSCLVEVTHGTSTFSKTLTQPGLTQELWKSEFQNYQIQFDVLPYPELGKSIDKSDYQLRMVITKSPALSGGILATFDVQGEKYSIFITNISAINQVLELQRGESSAEIPSGRLLRGAVEYNKPWSWHIDSEDIHTAEITMELCDGTPSQVEANLDYWVDTVQRFCPWGAKLVEVKDYR